MIGGRKPFAFIEDCSVTWRDPTHPLKLAHQTMSVADDLLENVTDLPERCRSVIARATHLDKKSRYGSAKEFHDAIKAALAPSTDSPAAQVPERRQGGRWAITIGVAMLGAALALGIFLWWTNQPAAGPFKGHLDFELRERGGAVAPGLRRLGDPKTPFLKKGDRGRLHAELTAGADAYFYIIWIDSKGHATPHYPEGWVWGTPPRAQEKLHVLTWPPQNKGAAPLADSPTGLESIVWLVRARRLSPQDHAALQTIFTGPGFKWKQDPKNLAEEIYLIENGKVTSDRGPLDVNNAGIADHPVFQLETALAQSHQQALADYSRAVCYPFFNP
jgi:hypothetical protein